MSAPNANIAKATAVVQRAPSWLWIRDTGGFPSVSVTLLVVAFVVTTLAFLASIFVSIGPLAFRAFDVAACSAYFVPILSLYFGRRWTDAKYPIAKAPEAVSTPEDKQ
jgi:hypothetical protein